MQLSFENLPPENEVILDIGNRATSVIHHRGARVVPLGFAHFVNDLAFCLNAPRETAFQWITEPETAPAMPAGVLEARAAELARHISQALSAANVSPEAARIASPFRIPGIVVGALEDALRFPCRPAV